MKIELSKLESLMFAAGLSQAALARRLGVSRHYAYRLMKRIREQKQVNITTVHMVAKALQCEVQALIDPAEESGEAKDEAAR
jgi:DNA-binding transcriptional regulator LsrR (DeoR family)